MKEKVRGKTEGLHRHNLQILLLGTQDTNQYSRSKRDPFLIAVDLRNRMENERN
jgi:hypothetical protein